MNVLDCSCQTRVGGCKQKGESLDEVIIIGHARLFSWTSTSIMSMPKETSEKLEASTVVQFMPDALTHNITQAFRAGVTSVAEDIIFRIFPAKVSALHTAMTQVTECCLDNVRVV